VIADLSANFVERQALLCGFSVERMAHDYGIDLRVFTYNQDGEVENGEILLQLKATDHLKVIARGQMVAFRIERADLRTWLQEPMPVFLVVFDAVADVAYWLYVQAHFAVQPAFRPTRGPAEVTVRIPRTNVVDQAAMRHFASCRDRLLTQIQGRLEYHD
jgi:hypothetical protein